MRRVLALLICLLPGLAFGQQIPQLPAASTPLSGNEVTVVVQNGITKQTNVASIAGNATLPSAPGNTLLGNSTGSATTAFPIAMPSCNSSANGLTWTLGSGFGCNTFSPSGNVSGPGTTTVGYIPTWANTGGTLLNNGVLASTTINGVVCAVGSACTIAAMGSPQIIVGSTQITGGTSGDIVYDNAGIIGEKGVTGTGNVVLQTSPTLLGTVTLPDSSTASASGIANLTALGIGGGIAGQVNISGTYSSAATAPVNVNPTFDFSSTANGVGAISFNPVLAPTGASAGNTHGMIINAGAAAGAVNFSDLRSLRLTMNTNASYTGTLALGHALMITTPTISGTHPITSYFGEEIQVGSNGTGLSSVSVSNTGLAIDTLSAVAGTGSTLTNTMLSISLPAGSNTGTATNCGICITGNGQTGGTTTNWAINSTSTADSELVGGLDNTPIGQTTAAAITGTNVTASTAFWGGGLGVTSFPTGFNGALGLISNGSAANISQVRYGANPNIRQGTALGTYASPMAVTSGTLLGQMAFYGYDGSNFQSSGSITVSATGTISTGVVPGVMAFGTANASGVVTEAFRINQSQVLSVSSGLVNSVTLAGSNTTPTVSTSNGVDLLVGSGAGHVQFQNGILGSGPGDYFGVNVGFFSSPSAWQFLQNGYGGFVVNNSADGGWSFITSGTGTAGATAPTPIQFRILNNTSGAAYWEVTSGSAAASMTTNAGNGTIGTAGGATSLTDISVDLPNIASSASALDAVCWNATGGVLTHNSTGALCSASLEELKDMLGAITAADADADLMALRPFWGKFKDSVTSISDHRVQPFFGAHQVESVDPRLVEYDDKGNLRSVRYANITALLTAAYQQQKQEIANLAARMSAIEASDRRQAFNSVN